MLQTALHIFSELVLCNSANLIGRNCKTMEVHVSYISGEVPFSI